ncbi:zinc finger protein 69-like [Planococcus citri]|uniref:zinc finger protein 69-like n=1 Tax=Planococcus citri TaxID=170843 RepID=UPI0031F827CD
MNGEGFDGYGISCPKGCGKTYKYKSSVRNHLRECGVEPQFVCRVSRLGGYEKAASKSTQQASEIFYFYCPLRCGRKYKYKWNLNQHLRYECGQEKQFKCTMCSKTFAHKRIISDVFVCPNTCGRSYKYRAGLYQHLKYECGRAKQFQCFKCFKDFARRSSLKIHLSNVHSLV